MTRTLAPVDHLAALVQLTPEQEATRATLATLATLAALDKAWRNAEFALRISNADAPKTPMLTITLDSVSAAHDDREADAEVAR